MCESCGLDYGFADSGDGPAVFIMFLAGFIVVGAALITEAVYHPPYWVHAALWLPLIPICTLGPLRPMKGLMIWLRWRAMITATNPHRSRSLCRALRGER